jgi:hypothetical protein
MTGDEAAATGSDSSLEEIPREECFRLLAGQTIGRVAVADFGSAPLVVPVNFLLVGETVVFRTDYVSKFRLAVLGEHPVSFQVDAVEPWRPSHEAALLVAERPLSCGRDREDSAPSEGRARLDGPLGAASPGIDRGRLRPAPARGFRAMGPVGR